METKEILKIAANALNDKKALDLNAIKVDDLTVLTEYFLMASATSSTHVRSLAEEVEFKLSESGLEPHHIEGRTTGWILLDYGSVIVHVFNKESREFYNLDKMWNDGQAVDLDTILTNEQEKA
ncbi:MAG: ribosome silencing factor [Ruminococcaceae bacterium]|jgi:ribosome-associated protein|nr:ribosome silencing factor [Oscillospiraceae bacterium]MEE1198666.1 ribosome silencing factor [Acutalibacteraceae bacterium]